MRKNRKRNRTSLLGKTITDDTAGRVSQVTAIPPCPTGLNCLSQQTTLSRYNGHNQRFLRETDQGQTVFVYGTDGYSVLFESEHRLVDATTVSTTTETIYLPTASGPMPVVAVINGAPYAIHADHLNTPRRLTDAQGQPRWQWPFSGFGEQAPQSIPAAGQPTIRFSLRYPGQVDDGNGLFYNFNRFYDPLAGRYTKADPIGLDGGWNRFGYVGGNALRFIDPAGLGPWDKLYGFPKTFWRWFHKEDPKLFKELKDPKTGQIPKEDAQPYYDAWKKDQEGFFDPQLGEILLPWWFSPSPIYTLPCEMPGGPPCSPQTCPRNPY